MGAYHDLQFEPRPLQVESFCDTYNDRILPAIIEASQEHFYLKLTFYQHSMVHRGLNTATLVCAAFTIHLEQRARRHNGSVISKMSLVKTWD